MKTKIYIKSASNYYGRQIYFIYKDGAGDCHTCASIIWDNRGPSEHLNLNPYILKLYGGYHSGYPLFNNNIDCFEIETLNFPCNLITDLIKNYMDEVLGVKAYKIEYLYKNHMKTFLRDYNQVKQQQAIIN